MGTVHIYLSKSTLLTKTSFYKGIIFNHIINMALRLIFLFFILLHLSKSQNCPLTTRDVEGPFYESGAPISKQIAPDQDFNPSTAIYLKGQVFDRNCQPIPNVIVDVWYAGGNPVAYTFPPSTLWYRGKGFTDTKGKYEFNATYPGTYSGRPIPHIHYKVFDGKKELTTQLYFKTDVPRNFEDYVERRQSQFPQKILATKNERIITFDVVLDTN